MACLALVMSIVGCQPESVVSPAGTASLSATASAAAESDARWFAANLAVAMRDGRIRAQLRDAMRASLYGEHKLVLQDFLMTSAANDVVAAVAERAGVRVDDVRTRVASLPTLDFYMLGSHHRRTWRATDDVVVAASFDPWAAKLTAWDVNGSPLTLEAADVPFSRPVIILHPAELKGLREAPQPGMSGEVIQDSTDGASWSASLPTTLADNSPQASSARVASPILAGPTASLVTPGVYMNHFNVQLGDGLWGDLEMIFASHAVVLPILYWVGDHSQYPVFSAGCSLGSYVRGGIEEDKGYDGLYLLSPNVTNINTLSCNGSGAVYAIQIVEDDGGSSTNDEYGWRFYTQSSGTYPYGAIMGSVISYYNNTWEQARSAYVRIIYQ